MQPNLPRNLQQRCSTILQRKARTNARPVRDLDHSFWLPAKHRCQTTRPATLELEKRRLGGVSPELLPVRLCPALQGTHCRQLSEDTLFSLRPQDRLNYLSTYTLVTVR